VDVWGVLREWEWRQLNGFWEGEKTKIRTNWKKIGVIGREGRKAKLQKKVLRDMANLEAVIGAKKLAILGSKLEKRRMTKEQVRRSWIRLG